MLIDVPVPSPPRVHVSSRVKGSPRDFDRSHFSKLIDQLVKLKVAC